MILIVSDQDLGRVEYSETLMIDLSYLTVWLLKGGTPGPAR
jgi:hypothetical protein